MHLKQLILSGFKSFVDRTVLHFPSQLVAVLGPNGCGKSNIIDAVRWVLGESSAKNLRGESMIDVIFNGAAGRKPVGQASVELVFDNQAGRLTGPFASYGELSVKRVVTRDGDSSYYLNNSKCRRKDITDIFLGTGAGSRGYSIIGQGTISRMIEAKPEELRAFLEEAAGVSKYKERRRDTLQRMEQTREHLNRVADIRMELDKQLQRLERQAKSAERYTVLKEQESLYKAQIQALKWQEFDKQKVIKRNELQQLAVSYAQQQSLLVHASKERTVCNETMHEVNEQMQQIQASFYQLAGEIARIDEAIQQQARDKKRMEQERQQLQQDCLAVQEQLTQDKNQLAEAQGRAEAKALSLEEIKAARTAQEQQWQLLQTQHQAWELQWEALQQEHAALKSTIQVTQVSLEHLAQRRQQVLVRLEKCQAEQATVDLSGLQQEKEALEKQQIQLKTAQHEDEMLLEQSNQQINTLRQQVQTAEQQLHALQDRFHLINSEHVALLSVQKAARKNHLQPEGDLQELADKPKLMDAIILDKKWQNACDRVLNESLHAYILEKMDVPINQWQAHNCHGEELVTLRLPAEKRLAYPRLADKIQGKIPATVPNLEHIYTAEDLAEAMRWLPDLVQHESIVTADGFWLGVGWAKLPRHAVQDEPGLLARQQRINDLSVEVNVLQEQITAARLQRDQDVVQLKEQSQAMDALHGNLKSSNEALHRVMSLLASKTQVLEHAERRREALESEQSELQYAMEELAMEHAALSEKIHLQQTKASESEARYQDFLTEKKARAQQIDEQKKQIDALRDGLHQTELAYDRELGVIQLASDRIAREAERLDLLQERLEQLALSSAQSDEPEKALTAERAEKLLQHETVEQQLQDSKEHLNQIRLTRDNLDKITAQHEQEVKRLDELINQTRMEEQALSVRASSVQEALDESGLQVDTLLDKIPADRTQNECEQQLIQTMEQIKRLGAINLAAIEEFASEQQRLTYLNAQYDDLQEALATLETAIEKMDKETRVRLENTFDEVNTSFKALFPRLFGGGRAQLELTCDNLLEAGIVVMAQPPGKRNSTIHLLSGGEKAMTAVALVFAMFQLNPSPFCMLDEVDAPLDDTNVGRFCALVKEMSQFVQFLFITHNKVTMELADHLIGVTMREPGVSRLVAVDVKHALETCAPVHVTEWVAPDPVI